MLIIVMLGNLQWCIWKNFFKDIDLFNLYFSQATLRHELVSLHEMLEDKGRLVLPYNPSVEVIGLDMKVSFFKN